MSERLFPPVAPLATALRCHCPRCGRGRLFQGFIGIRPICEECGLDLSASDSGDGPAVFIIFIVGAVVVALALWLEVALSPPLWVHLALWFPLVIGGCLALLRPLKALMIALQYRHRAGEGGRNTFQS